MIAQANRGQRANPGARPGPISQNDLDGQERSRHQPIFCRRRSRPADPEAGSGRPRQEASRGATRPIGGLGLVLVRAAVPSRGLRASPGKQLAEWGAGQVWGGVGGGGAARRACCSRPPLPPREPRFWGAGGHIEIYGYVGVCAHRYRKVLVQANA